MSGLDDFRSLLDPDGSLGKAVGKHARTFMSVPRWCHVTCQACPTQADGRLADGRLWYFRARSGGWRIDVGDAPGDDPIGNTRHEGDDPSGGWMPGPEVVRLLETHLGEELDRQLSKADGA